MSVYIYDQKAAVEVVLGDAGRILERQDVPEVGAKTAVGKLLEK